MKYCKKCGQQLSDDATFCTKCGERINTNNSADPQRINNPAPLSLPMLLAVALALIMIMSAFILFGNRNHGSGKTGELMTEENKAETSDSAAAIASTHEEASEEPFSFPDLTSMDSIAAAVIFNCVEKDLSSWIPNMGNTDSFWDVMCFYVNSEEGIGDLNPPRAGNSGEFYVLSKRILINAAYACFPDFNGTLPSTDQTSSRAREKDQDNLQMGIGDSLNVVLKSSVNNEDKSVDAVYSFYNWGDSDYTDYKLHLAINPNYDKANDYFSYYYTVTRVERIGNKPEKKSEPEQQPETEQTSEKEQQPKAEQTGEPEQQPKAEQTGEPEQQPKTEKTSESDQTSVLEQGNDEENGQEDAHAPFYGIWCGASRDRAGAERIVSQMNEFGLPAEIFVSTDWSNLNTEKWYVISAGVYGTEQAAKDMLDRVKKYKPSAYVKYSGEWIGD